MPRAPKILWKKENSRNSNVFVDIFTIPNDEVFEKGSDELVEIAFKHAKPNANDAKQLAHRARECGKQYFRDGQYAKAMEQFNHTLLLASKDTVDMGFAYGNRSACFFELNLFDECLHDIEITKKSKYPRNQWEKLDTRAAKCIKFKNDDQFMAKVPTAREPKLSFPQHAKFTGVADCLKLKESDDYGRHVIATCDLKIGQTILIEKPYAIIPKRDYPDLRCVNCFKHSMSLMPCENCVSAAFCNDDCKEKSRHEYDCSQPITLSRKETFELVLNMFFKLNETFPNVDDLMEMVELLLNRSDFPDPSHLVSAEQREFGWIFQLVHNHEKQTQAHLRRFRGATTIAIATIHRNPILKRKFAALKYRRFLQHLLLHLFHVAEHSIDLMQYQQEDKNDPAMKYSLLEYASGMYPFACYFNHSCMPNVCCYSVDDRLICKVIRPIEKGQQVFRSYM